MPATAQDVANGQGVPSGGQNLAYALSRLAASLGASLMWEVWCWLSSGIRSDCLSEAGLYISYGGMAQRPSGKSPL